MSVGGSHPPLEDLVECVAVSKATAKFKGKNANEGYTVTIERWGETSYFKAGQKFKVKFDPVD